MSIAGKITLYRVMDKEGRGPFKPNFSATWSIPRKDHDNLIPFFFEHPDIFKRIKNSNCLCFGSACRTIKQLKRWFNKKEYRTLKRYGYQAYKIKVDKVLAESYIQVVFASMQNTIIGAIPINMH